VDRDTPVSIPPTVAPGSPAQNAPSRGSEGTGAPEAAGPSNGTRQRAVRGPCEVVEDSGRVAQPQLARRNGGDATVSEASPLIMMRRLTAERCANASIPALGLDASTPDAPLK
jgi:hypothetical protein